MQLLQMKLLRMIIISSNATRNQRENVELTLFEGEFIDDERG